jgi:hypothetical protein
MIWALWNWRHRRARGEMHPHHWLVFLQRIEPAQTQMRNVVPCKVANKRTIFCLTLLTAFNSPPKEKPSLSLPLSPLLSFTADESLARRVTRRDLSGSDARG